MKAALLKNINKILIPLFALTLVSCGESTNNSIVEPKNLGKEVDTKTIIVEGRQVTFKYGMNNEELYNAVSNLWSPVI